VPISSGPGGAHAGGQGNGGDIFVGGGAQGCNTDAERNFRRRWARWRISRASSAERAKSHDRKRGMTATVTGVLA
jgi:hypothetical protein